jgi:hypothetical protein
LNEDIMTLTRIVTTAAVAGSLLLPALSAFAQGSTRFYIVQDSKTHKCTILDKKPVAADGVIVGPDGAVYKTRSEAETAMKTVKVCTTP